MDIFVSLIGKLIPLYIFVVLGVVAGRNLGVSRESVSKLLIYILVPIVSFHGTAIVKLSPGVLVLPLVVFAICVSLSLLCSCIGNVLWTDKTRSVIGYTCGTGNNGYFGLPLVLSLFGEEAFGIAVIASIGFVMFEVTLGLYHFLHHDMTPAMAIRKILRFPIFLSFVFGLLWNFSGLGFTEVFTDIAVKSRGAYTVLGMMLIGMGLGSVREMKMDFPFLLLTFVSKFVLWPLFAFAVIWADTQYLHLFPVLAHNVFFVLSIVPLAASTVAYATEFRAQPEKAATAVLFSTLFALFYIPLAVTWFL